MSIWPAIILIEAYKLKNIQQIRLLRLQYNQTIYITYLFGLNNFIRFFLFLYEIILFLRKITKKFSLHTKKDIRSSKGRGLHTTSHTKSTSSSKTTTSKSSTEEQHSSGLIHKIIYDSENKKNYFNCKKFKIKSNIFH